MAVTNSYRMHTASRPLKLSFDNAGYIQLSPAQFHNSRSGLVVKFVVAIDEPRVRFTAATILFVLLDVHTNI